MKVVVLGAGLMGKEVARDLVASEAVAKIYLADLAVDRAQQIASTLYSAKIEVVSLNAENDTELREVIAKGDVVVNALFYKFNEAVAKAAIDVGVHVVDLGGHIKGITDNVLALSQQARAKGVTIVPDSGVAPGMINILTGFGASHLDVVESIKLYVGGIPVNPEPPLEYTEVFSLEGMFDHYTQPSTIISKGQKQDVPSLSGIEPIYFDNFGVLEAFYTSGGISTLAKSFPQVKTLEYKTIRYKGHAEKFKLLVDLGLIDESNKVTADGQEVSVRPVVREALKKKLDLGDKKDVVLLRVIVSGEKAEEQLTYEYEMVVKKDEALGVTAMARATANTASIVAQMIGERVIVERGVYPPELVVPGREFIEEMAKRGVHIKETSHRSTMIVKW